MARSGLSGLAQILSAEKMPRDPTLRGSKSDPMVEMENWVRELRNYLRRLFGRFTAQNIFNTIVTGDGVVLGVWEMSFEKWYKVGIGKPAGTKFSILNADWRGRLIVAGGSAIDDSGIATQYWNPGSGSFVVDKVGAAYNLDRTVASGTDGVSSWALVIRGTDGHPVLQVDTSAAILPMDVHLMAYATARKTVADITV